MNGQTFCVACM